MEKQHPTEIQRHVAALSAMADHFDAGQHIDEAFRLVATALGMKSGDITPEQDEVRTRLAADLYSLLADYVVSNLEVER
jgi:hypothetical protein